MTEDHIFDSFASIIADAYHGVYRVGDRRCAVEWVGPDDVTEQERAFTAELSVGQFKLWTPSPVMWAETMPYGSGIFELKLDDDYCVSYVLYLGTNGLRGHVMTGMCCATGKPVGSFGHNQVVVTNHLTGDRHFEERGSLDIERGKVMYVQTNRRSDERKLKDIVSDLAKIHLGEAFCTRAERAAS